MQVLLATSWTDPGGRLYDAHDVVDVDAVTLAELEELGVVNDLKTQPTTLTGSRTEPDEDPSKVVGPGPGLPEPAPGEPGDDGPQVPAPQGD